MAENRHDITNPDGSVHSIFHFKGRDGEVFQVGDGGKHLQLTAERLAESAQNQADWNNSPHLTISPGMAHVHKARREALEWLQAARSVELELHQDHTKQERKEIQSRYNHLLTLLAEALATCGNYGEALMVLPKHRVDLRCEFERIYGAIERPDDERCGEECKRKFDADPTKVTQESVEKYVFSIKHGRLVPVIRCSSCGEVNARLAEGDLAKQIEARSRAVELTKGKRPEDVPRILTEAGLTSKQIFKIT